MMICKPCTRPCRVGVQSRATFRSARPLVAPAPRVQRLPSFVARAVNSDKILDDVREIIAEQLGKDLGEVKSESKFVDLGADSLDTVEIMMALEEKFDIQLDEEGAEKIATVEDAAKLIAGQVASA